MAWSNSASRRQELGAVARDGGAGKRAPALAEMKQGQFFRWAHGKRGGLRLLAAVDIGQRGLGRQLDALKIGLRLERERQLALVRGGRV